MYMKTLCNTSAVSIMFPLDVAATQGGDPRSATPPVLIFSEVQRQATLEAGELRYLPYYSRSATPRGSSHVSN